jgi:hypothetical protein
MAGQEPGGMLVDYYSLRDISSSISFCFGFFFNPSFSSFPSLDPETGKDKT